MRPAQVGSTLPRSGFLEQRLVEGQKPTANSFIGTVLALSVLSLLVAPLLADDGVKKARGAETLHLPPKAPVAVAEQVARDILAKFELAQIHGAFRYYPGDPGWRLRMESLVRLGKAGPAVVPVLVEALKNGSPRVRDLAAQALVSLADTSTRPALLRAVNDPHGGVSRVYAIKALGMLGKLDSKEKAFQQILTNDPDWEVRRYLAWACERNDGPATAAAVRTALKDYDSTKIDTARLDELAPDFSLTDAFGKTYRLGDFRGKKAVVLVFYDEGL